MRYSHVRLADLFLYLHQNTEEKLLDFLRKETAFPFHEDIYYWIITTNWYKEE